MQMTSGTERPAFLFAVMNAIRSLPSLTICLGLLMSVCPLGSTSTSTSLWGKKLQFTGRPCLWQLQPEAVIPALEELSACMLLRRTIATEWTGFVYKAPGERQIELGLGGTGDHLTVWLFGKKQNFLKELRVHEWYSVCLTWSGQAQRLTVYVNGTRLDEAPQHPILPKQLAQNGTLTLGVSHYVDRNGVVQPESGNNLLGEIGLFRIWVREWSAEELRQMSCADGDVVSWDLRQWKYGCPPQPNNNLHCVWSLYKIKMRTVILHSTNPENCSVSPEEITTNWLKSIFPPNMSVQYISVSSRQSFETIIHDGNIQVQYNRDCPAVNKSATQHAQQPQGLEALSNSTCDKCFSCEVYVNVDPAANVEVVQANITTLLSLTFSDNFLNLTVDSNSMSVLPVVTQPAPTLSTGVPTSETSPTQSLPPRPTNTSTTREPLDINETTVGPDTFFRVNLTLSVTGSPTKPKDIIEKWLEQQLEGNNTMTVLNLVIKEKVDRNMLEQYVGWMTYHSQEKQYNGAFHVQEYSVNSVAEVKTFINAALTSKYENGSIVIETMDLSITHIKPGNCLEEAMSTIYGQYIWPEAFPQANQDMICKKPKSERAYRVCKLHIKTDMTSWADPDMTNCRPLVTISDLDNITVTSDNAAVVVDMIQDLVDVQLGNSEELSSSELEKVVDKLIEVVDISIINPAVGADIVNIVSDILVSKTVWTSMASTVLKFTTRMADNMDFEGESVSVTAPSLALSMINVQPDDFRGLTFGVSSDFATMNPTIFVNNFVSEPLPESNATISLPSALHNYLHPGVRNRTRVQFQFYGTNDLFQDPYINNATQNNWTLNSYIVSASINNSRVVNLKDRVVVTLSHQTPKQAHEKVQCVFWDFQKNGGQGGWSSSGCETQNSSPYQTSCLCDHLTNFAVLLDVSRDPISKTDAQILTVISYIGCGISSIFLGITLLTYLLFDKLRRDYPAKILINLSAALLGLNLLFLLDGWLSSFSNYGLCIATAATLHYLLLASFTWMGLEAVHMYFALVKVFNTYVPSYILKFCAVGWGIPLVIVSLVLAIDKDAYGNIVPEEAAAALESTDPFCWLQDDVVFYVTAVTFVLLILLCNTSVFIVVLIQIRRMGANKASTNSRSSLHDLRAVASLTVLLGLTWSTGFFSFGPGKVVMMYLFSIFSTLQGFFIFLFHCLMKENVRKQWRVHLCCGRFRLTDCSDWSRSATVGCKKNNFVNSDSVASDNTSSTRSLTPLQGQQRASTTRGHEWAPA